MAEHVPRDSRIVNALRIVSDRNIPFVEQAFASIGSGLPGVEVVTLPAAQIDAAAVRDAEMLLCRTTIKVNASLLEGSRVRFVATATIGTDHLDIPWLETKGIRWAAAPGSNADSVQLWFVCALAHYCRARALDPTTLRIGVVGVGHVGSRVARVAQALGMAPLLCDPPRARSETGFVELDEVLSRCDVVTLHVPLSNSGPDRTRGLIDAAKIQLMKKGALLVNACRGEVVEEEALIDAVRSGRITAICDVFPNEPTPSKQLIDGCLLATPHIAGHSLDGKVNGTDMIYRAACAYLGVQPSFDVHALLDAVEPADVLLGASERNDLDVLHDALVPFYDITIDDRALRELVQRGESFRTYRDRYPERREPRGVRVQLSPRRSHVAAVLSSLGMLVSTH